ncbi:unnamed protein product [Mytilus coruscus]|uniref:Uncharacterized protein n=1 Tax=Mytilus coruscus TaxID=42192 RepID=A0A6J8B6C4_MYTCO|nr:unnamed protein product [Mytilus coruscus]
MQATNKRSKTDFTYQMKGETLEKFNHQPYLGVELQQQPEIQKRGILPALSELTNFHGKKKKDVQNGDNGKKISETSEEEMDISDMSTENNTTDTGETGSSCDDVNKISRKQRTFAKMSVRRDKKKDQEKREKLDKNIISMDDFLNKHGEFSTWIEEEKHKCTKKMSSPKLKAYFKDFMKLWNKRKLPVKYYRGSTDSESPCPTYIARGFSFDEEEIFDSRKQLCRPKKRLSIETHNVLDSPFSTFGKTPPKLLPAMTSLHKLETHHEIETQKGYASLNSPVEEIKEQILSQYQVPVKQSRIDSDQESNKENTHSLVEPYYVTPYSWASGGERKDTETSSDHFSSSSSLSSQSEVFPVYAKIVKQNKIPVVQKSEISIPSQNSPPPIPLPPKICGDYFETENFSSDDVHYKSVDMDSTDLPPPPPPMDLSSDDSQLNATLPPPPVDQSGEDSFINATLPSPPGYAEIGCLADDPDLQTEGEWKPPSAAKVYSPRKFKLTKSTSKERIYTEIPPPVAPKPKRKMFFDSLYQSEENMYVAMNSNPVQIEKDNNEPPVLYSDYAVPADVITSDINKEPENNDETEQSKGKIEDSNITCEIQKKVSDTINREDDFEVRSSLPQKDQIEQSVVSEKTEPFIFRTSGKGCSDVLGGCIDNAINDTVDRSDLDRNKNCKVNQFKDKTHSNVAKLFTNENNSGKVSTEKFDVGISIKGNPSQNVLETDIDTINPQEEKKKLLPRTKSSETIIW